MEFYLKECLEYSGYDSLPEKWDGERIFEKAICLCRMRTGALEYIIVGLDEDRKLYGKKTFGIGIIEEFLDVYPIDYGIKNKYAEIIKADCNDVFSDRFVGEWGVIGITNAEQAYEWVMTNKRGAGIVSRKPEKLKERIKEILNYKL